VGINTRAARSAVAFICLVVGIGFAVGWLPRAAGERATAASQRATATGSQVFLPVLYQTYQLPYFFDDFSNPASGWPISQTSIGSWGYVNGQYRMQILTGGYTDYAGNSLYASDFQAQVSAYSDTPTIDNYGLYFGLISGVGKYFFDVSPNSGTFSLWRHDDVQNSWISVVGWTYSPAILTSTQTNLLKVTRSGSTITMYVNQQQLSQVVDSTLGAGYVGLATASAYANAEAFFDNFAFTSNMTTPLAYTATSSTTSRTAQPGGNAGSDLMNPR
jgi:hypothetical protein